MRVSAGLAAGAAAVLLLGTSLFAVLVHASLYANGANDLLQIVGQRGFLFLRWDRSGADLLTQAPLYLSVIGAVIVTIYPATFFLSVSESVTAYPVYLVMAVILAPSRPLTASRVVTLLLCSAVLPLTYETSVLFGPLLAIWSLGRFRRGRDAAIGRAALLVPMLAGLAAGVTSAWTIAHPIDSRAEQSVGILSGLGASHEFDAACLVLIAALALALARRRPWIIAAGEATVLGVAALFTAVGSAEPGSQYTIRLAPAFILLPLFIALWNQESWPRLRLPSLAGSRRLGYAVVALVAALAIQNATLLWGWHDFFSSLEHQVTTSHAGEYGWPRTFPSMSRIVQDWHT